VNLDELMSQIPIGDLAAQLGVSDAEAEEAVKASLPALVGGMQANAQDPAGAASLKQALAQHDGSLLEGGVDLAQVDTTDGEKIVKNVFGENEEAVVNQLGGLGGGLSSGLIAKLLPMLAPLLMSFLGKSFGGGGSSPAPSSGSSDTSGMGPGATGMGPGTSAPEEGNGSGGGLGDILGGLLGGGAGGGLGGLGDVLGGLLGGGKR
jgi:hypothetical protein